MKRSASELGLTEQDFFLPKRCLKTLYSCLVHPYCHYCIIVWWSTYKTNLRRLVFLQKRVVWSPKNLTACLNSSSTSIKIHTLHELFSHFTLETNSISGAKYQATHSVNQPNIQYNSSRVESFWIRVRPRHLRIPNPILRLFQAL